MILVVPEKPFVLKRVGDASWRLTDRVPFGAEFPAVKPLASEL